MSPRAVAVSALVVFLTVAGTLTLRAHRSAGPASAAPSAASSTTSLGMSSSCGTGTENPFSCGAGTAPPSVSAGAESKRAEAPKANSQSVPSEKRHAAFVTDIPPRAVLRQEAARDPHATPASLIRFSVELGRKVRDSLGSEATARGAFAELSDCAAGNDALQVQTLCLSQAKTIQDKYGSLSGDYNDLLKKVPPKVRTLAQLIE